MVEGVSGKTLQFTVTEKENREESREQGSRDRQVPKVTPP